MLWQTYLYKPFWTHPWWFPKGNFLGQRLWLLIAKLVFRRAIFLSQSQCQRRLRGVWGTVIFNAVSFYLEGEHPSIPVLPSLPPRLLLFLILFPCSLSWGVFEHPFTVGQSSLHLRVLGKAAVRLPSEQWTEEGSLGLSLREMPPSGVNLALSPSRFWTELL